MFVLCVACMEINPARLEGRNKRQGEVRKLFPSRCAVVSDADSRVALEYLGAAFVQKRSLGKILVCQGQALDSPCIATSVSEVKALGRE